MPLNTYFKQEVHFFIQRMSSLCLSCSTTITEWSIVFEFKFFITDHSPINFDHFFTFTIHCSVTLRKQFAATWAKQRGKESSSSLYSFARQDFKYFVEGLKGMVGLHSLFGSNHGGGGHRNFTQCTVGPDKALAAFLAISTILHSTIVRPGHFQIQARSNKLKLCPNKNFPQLRRFSSIFRYQCIIHFILIIQL